MPDEPATTRFGALAGAFVAVVGPSGAGKDSILSLCRERLESSGRIRFARRVVTRPCDGGTEVHDSLAEAEFEAAERGGAFCLSWRAHGLCYGLPAELLGECEAGRSIVANVSRRALAEAAARFPSLHVVEITAPPALLVARIAARGRETAQEIERRLARSVPLVVPEGAQGLHVIDNSGSVETAAARFEALVRGLAGGIEG